MKRTAMILALFGAHVLVSSTLAISSTNYALDWFAPLTGGGGGAAGSTNYAANFTVGQSAIGASTSTNYEAGLGYWYGAGGEYRVYLPVMLKSYS